MHQRDRRADHQDQRARSRPGAGPRLPGGSAWRADYRALLGEVRSRYRPNQVVALAVLGDREALAVVPLLADRPTLDGHATAYVCEHFACQHPVTEPEALAAQLG